MISNLDKVLNYPTPNGKMDLSYIREEYEMAIKLARRQEILQERHPYSVSLGSDNYWRTYLPDPIKGRRQIKRKERDSIEKVIIDYWENVDSNTFKKRFDIWVERQKACGRSDNTLYKYRKDYERFIAGDRLESMNIQDINEEEISLFIGRLLNRKNVHWRALEQLFGYINGVFEKSFKDRVINENPCKRVDLPIFRSKCVDPRTKTAEERTVSKEEKDVILDMIRNDDRVEKYAVQLAFSSGMRVGELSGLAWSDINFQHGFITICHSEKSNRLTRATSISSTKTGRIRTIPITDTIKKILFSVRDYESQKGIYGDFVFMDENGRISARRISSYLSNKTRSADFTSTKSIHAIRRTVNSNMRKNGVPAFIAASLLGHSERVNEINYTYNIASMDERRDILTAATS